MASMPTARGDFGVAVVAGKIYVIGGTNETSETLNVVEEYNPLTNEWTTKKPMPTPRSGLAVAVYDGKIYAFGGTVGSNVYVGNNEIYDPVSDSWSTKTSMPTPRAGLSANTVNDGIYLIGGERYSSIAPFRVETDVNEVYNPLTDQWVSKSPLPNAVAGYGSAVVGDKIYFIGGSRWSVSTGNALLTSDNQVYDTQIDQWSSAKMFPFAVSWGAAIATTGYLAPQRVYYFGGSSAGSWNRTEMFNPVANSWSTVESMPVLRERLGVIAHRDIMYVIGGFNGTDWVGSVEQFMPAGYGVMPPAVQITSPENKTYSEVSLSFTANRGTVWMGYSLDGQANVTITKSTTLFGLSQGSHRIVIFANDSVGNMGVSNTVYFSIDLFGPIIDILTPINQSYSSTDIALIFTLDEPVSALSYSLDGAEKIALFGNVTLPALSQGSHHLTVFAVDEVGNASEKTVYFSIEQFPFVLIVAVIVISIIVFAIGYLLYKHLRARSSSSKYRALSKDSLFDDSACLLINTEHCSLF